MDIGPADVGYDICRIKFFCLTCMDGLLRVLRGGLEHTVMRAMSVWEMVVGDCFWRV